MKTKAGQGKIMRIAEAVLAAVIIAVLAAAIRKTAIDGSEGGTEQLERSIKRCIMACYADEGIYPQDLDYLTENYGLQIDEERFAVYYTVYGGNLMPVVTVLERGSVE